MSDILVTYWFKDTAIFYTTFQWFLLNILQLFGFAALQFIHYTVQNHQQDWNDVLIEGTIMLITLLENSNTVKTIHCTTLKEGEKGRRSVLSSQPSLYWRGADRKILDMSYQTCFVLRTITLKFWIMFSLPLNGFLLEYTCSLVKVCVCTCWSQQADQMPASFQKLFCLKKDEGFFSWCLL